MKTPDEIKRYQKIISNKDAILADAQAKADTIIAETKVQVQEMVKESEVMQQAYAQANETVNTANRQAQEIIDAATNDANNLRLSAISYTDEMMANMGQIMANTLEDAGAKYNEFVRYPAGFSGCDQQKQKRTAAPAWRSSAGTGNCTDRERIFGR